MVLSWKHKQIRMTESKVSINIFILGLMLLPIYIKLMGTLSEILSFSTTYTTYLYYGLLWFFLLNGIWEIRERLVEALFIMLMLAMLLVVEIMTHSSSLWYILGSSMRDIFTFQSTAIAHLVFFIPVGMAVTDFDNLSMLLHKGARVGILAAFLTYALMLIYGIEIHYDDMSTSYGIALVLCILVALYEKGDWSYVATGGLCLILGGTRGPILCFIAALLLKALCYTEGKKRRVYFVLLCLLTGAFVLSDLSTQLLKLLSTFLTRFGIKQLRLLDYLSNNMMLDGSSREDYAALLIEYIGAQPILGYGIGGDRIILKGTYAHNLILEMLIDYGIIVGGLLLICLVGLIIGILRSPRKNVRKLGIGLCCGILLKLMLSSSYTISKEFFLFIGLCIAAMSDKNAQRKELAQVCLNRESSVWH